MPGDRRFLVGAIVFCILLAGLALRLAGVDGQGYPFSFYPDEVNNVERAVRFYDPGRGFDLNPHWFNKPALGYYINFGEFGFYYLWGRHGGGLWERPGEFALDFIDNRGPFYIIARTGICLFGALTILVVYRIARRLFDRTTGVIAAAVLALCPGHVAWSQVVKHDVGATFLMTMSLAWSLKVADRGRRRDSILAGLLAGLGAAMKYFPFVCVVPIVAAHLFGPAWRGRPVRRRLVVCGASLGALYLGFFAGSPYNTLDGTWMSQNVASVLNHAWSMLGFGAGETDPTQDTPLGLLLRAAWIFLGFRPGDWAFGVPATALFVVGLVGAWRTPRRFGVGCVFCTLVGYLFLLTVANQEYPHKNHLVPLYPMAAIFAATGFVALTRKLARFEPAARPLRTLAIFVVVMVLIPVPGFPGFEAYRRTREVRALPSQLVALYAVEHLVPPGATIINDTEIVPLGISAERLDWIVEGRLEPGVARAREGFSRSTADRDRRHFQRLLDHGRSLLTKYELVRSAAPQSPRVPYDVIVLLKVWQTESAEREKEAAFGYNRLWDRRPLGFPEAVAHTPRCYRVIPSELATTAQRQATPVFEGRPAEFFVSGEKSYDNYLVEEKRREWPWWAKFYDDLKAHYDCWEVNGDRSLPGPVIRIWDLRRRLDPTGGEAPTTTALEADDVVPR